MWRKFCETAGLQLKTLDILCYTNLLDGRGNLFFKSSAVTTTPSYSESISCDVNFIACLTEPVKTRGS